ncbi:hypothetical protein Ddye_009656 [Dipteronia dyeriana]|uniref:Uncharacterized protein n=1 Tax=Dipteronia dyeriana TaxID=168575 RepID=A0AAE0CMK5_9ROSI|nr:hypothetical protein Ddye_009656 [Dipteronia dyeriana]
MRRSKELWWMVRDGSVRVSWWRRGCSGDEALVDGASEGMTAVGGHHGCGEAVVGVAVGVGDGKRGGVGDSDDLCGW